MTLFRRRQFTIAIAASAAMLSGLSLTMAADGPAVSFSQSAGELQISIGGEAFATYVYNDSTIPRPYFAHVQAPGGIQATRHQPPIAGQDLVDHPTFHPGIWLAFGDLNGADDWRLAAPVKHVSFVKPPEGTAGGGSFEVINRYVQSAPSSEPICDERFHCDVRVTPAGYLLLWDSTFSSDREFAFGDQEEMGLGLRVATPLRAQRQAEGGVAGGNGEIRDAAGRLNEAGVWGNSSEWCDYSGVIDGQRVGMTILTHPENFRPSWFHARDRGLLVANPFGRAAFHKGEKSKVIVKPGESLRLRYGILVHSGAAESSPDLDAAYRAYVELTRDE